MPFRNLNQDPELEWLSAGMAETMLSDLRRSGMRIVMRDALDTAIAEMALQGVRATDESSAARIGRLVGARTMVFGGYQTAAGQLRITARFVEVETSLVLDAAMVTGPITNVLSLQDEVLTVLLGRPPGSPATVATVAPSQPRRPPRTKAPPEPQPPTKAPTQPLATRIAPASEAEAEQALEAYKLFSMSLTVSSAEERRRLLERSMSLSPDFHYSKEQLEALESRLIALRLAREDEAAARMRERITDESILMPFRVAAVSELIRYYNDRRMYLTLFSELEWIESLDWEEPHQLRIATEIARTRINSLFQTGQLGRAITLAQEARESLLAHPDQEEVKGHLNTVESRLLWLTQQQIQRMEKLEDLDEALARFPETYERLRSRAEQYAEQLEQVLARQAAKAAELEEATDETQRAILQRELDQITDYLRGSRNLFQAAWDNLRRRQIDECRVMKQHHAYRRAATLCLELAEQIREDAHPNWEVHEDRAIHLAIDALSQIGAYEEAAEFVDLYVEDPERTYYRSVYSYVNLWPAEIRPDLPEPPRRR